MSQFLFVCFLFVFLRQGFPVALEPVLELALIDQAGLALIQIRLPLPPECWYIKGVHHHLHARPSNYKEEI